MGSDFGSFLFELDELSGRILDDDSQQENDNNETLTSIGAENNNATTESEDDVSEPLLSNHDSSTEAKTDDKYSYKPSNGEDIYGRTVEATRGKYLPPAKRLAVQEVSQLQNDNVNFIHIEYSLFVM